jgi:D-alanine transaminase
MSRVAYVNGQYLPFHAAGVHVEDRGFQFADGVYEVVYLHHGRLIDEAGHLDRLERSLRELAIAEPMSRRALRVVMHEIIRRNVISSGILYIQVTRGVARRDHPFPEGVAPGIVMTVRRIKPTSPATLAAGVAVISTPDIRWKRCDIKSVSLLPNVLSKQAAKQAGAYEAWMVDEKGFVTEGSSTNAWIVTQAGELITREVSSSILNGITRITLIELARKAGIAVVERPFTLAEAVAAKEAFLSSTTSYALPVTSIDGHAVGDGKPGPLTLLLRQSYESTVVRGVPA